MENGDNFYTEGTGITEKPENDIEIIAVFPSDIAKNANIDRPLIGY